jgi:hypothetical protein
VGGEPVTANLVAATIFAVVNIWTWRAAKCAERAAWNAAHRASAQAAAVRATTQARPCTCHDQAHDEVTR